MPCGSRYVPVRTFTRAAAGCLLAALLAAGAAHAQAGTPPPEIAHQLPRGFEVISLARLSVPGAAIVRYVVALAREGEDRSARGTGGGVIAVEGRYFTVENGVACGQHWTDYVTFRLDPAAGRFVFDNERTQSWSLNTSTAPDAEALVPDGAPAIWRGIRGAPIAFADWRRPWPRARLPHRRRARPPRTEALSFLKPNPR